SDAPANCRHPLLRVDRVLPGDSAVLPGDGPVRSADQSAGERLAAPARPAATRMEIVARPRASAAADGVNPVGARQPRPAAVRAAVLVLRCQSVVHHWNRMAWTAGQRDGRAIPPAPSPGIDGR